MKSRGISRVKVINLDTAIPFRFVVIHTELP
jgi:hypothetical protein